MKQGPIAHRARMRHPRKPGNFVRNQTFESNGGDVKIRGNPQQIVDKYLTMARDANSSGDRVAAENYFQHAEHYYRLINYVPYHDQRDRPPQNMASNGETSEFNQPLVEEETAADDNSEISASPASENVAIPDSAHNLTNQDIQQPDGMQLPAALIGGAVEQNIPANSADQPVNIDSQTQEPVTKGYARRGRPRTLSIASPTNDGKTNISTNPTTDKF